MAFAGISRTWSANSIELVNRLREQQKYYATVNDIIVMDRIKDLELGDSLSLNQVTELGSHDYTIKGQPMVDPSLFKIEATVIEHPDGKLFTVTKKKQRTAHHKTTYHRNRYTMLRVAKIDVNKF
ncbi:ribosomal protein L21-like protein [Kickxella alabastrina]|uniref:ribosomal protein L21-like protein n=1 Tax=Kickxella alabastrina TaxID=61397 RepID=UPI00221ED989|nr:ribosomal protein L21-like protein [Kickxella alabastrina]KAI7833718.1 ribosomal protein L21-like protein [Kickxella alabastrina]